jgi:hypothetical protein
MTTTPLPIRGLNHFDSMLDARSAIQFTLSIDHGMTTSRSDPLMVWDQ